MIIKKTGDFKPAPEGMASGVCVDIVDLGMVQTMYGEKHKIKLVFQIDKLMENGKRFLVSKRFTASIHPNSSFVKFLRSWRGKPLEGAELEGFDTERLVGAPIGLVIEHQENDGQVFANITAVIKPLTRLTPDTSYVRVKDRPDAQQSEKSQPKLVDVDFSEQASGQQEVDDRVPF